MKLALALLAALVLASPASQAQQQHPFQPGERVRFEVGYLGMTVGELELSVGEEREGDRVVWPLRLAGHTRGLASSLMKVKETFISRFDPVAGVPLGNERRIRQNDWRQQEWIRFADGRAHIRTVKPAEQYEQELEVPIGVHDIVSGVYHLRGLDLADGAELRFPLFTGRKSWELTTRVAGRERVSTELGVFSTIRLDCRTRFEGKFASQRALRIWVTDDARRIPVKVEADFALGSMRAEIVEYVPGLVATAERRGPVSTGNP